MASQDGDGNTPPIKQKGKPTSSIMKQRPGTTTGVGSLMLGEAKPARFFEENPDDKLAETIREGGIQAEVVDHLARTCTDGFGTGEMVKKVTFGKQPLKSKRLGALGDHALRSGAQFLAKPAYFTADISKIAGNPKEIQQLDLLLKDWTTELKKLEDQLVYDSHTLGDVRMLPLTFNNGNRVSQRKSLFGANLCRFYK
jgi:hypothetical protein